MIILELKEILKRIHGKKLYYYSDAEELMDKRIECLESLYEFNRTRPSELGKRHALLNEMFAEIGEGCYIEPPLRITFGGHHVHFGNVVYANFNLTLIDDTHIYVGDNVMFGPNVVLTTATHPIHPELRKKRAEYNLSIKIGNNVWIGAGAIILPGVTIGDNSVIGAGSVVKKDIPENVVAVGNPCKILRKISNRDFEYYHRDLVIDIE